MSDMTVTINGTRLLAERACRWVFGEDADDGPQLATPEPLLVFLKDWPPGKTDEAVELALELPIDFDVERDLGRGKAKAVVIRACRITVLHQGQKVGHALRTDKYGLNAIRLWAETWEAFRRQIRQAH